MAQKGKLKINMANRQTKSLRKRGLSLKFNRGADFSHMGQTRHTHPEFTIQEMPSYKGICVNSNFSAREKTENQRRSAWRGCPSSRD